VNARGRDGWFAGFVLGNNFRRTGARFGLLLGASKFVFEAFDFLFEFVLGVW